MIDTFLGDPMLRNRMILFMSILFVLLGLNIIVEGIKALMNPTPGKELGPFLLFLSGSLFLYTGISFPKMFLRK